MKFKLSIVAPSGKVYEDSIDSIAVVGTEGGFEVYARHMPLIATLKAGKARIRKDGAVTAFEIPSGILEVDLDHNVTVLADQATPV